MHFYEKFLQHEYKLNFDKNLTKFYFWPRETHAYHTHKFDILTFFFSNSKNK